MPSLSILACIFNTVDMINCTGRNWKLNELVSKLIFLQISHVSKVKCILEDWYREHFVVLGHINLICPLENRVDSAGWIPRGKELSKAFGVTKLQGWSRWQR